MIRSEQPSTYYLGSNPEVSVVDASGATRNLQDVAIEKLRTQSRSNGYFVVENRLDEGIRFDTRGGRMVMTGKNVPVSDSDVFIKVKVIASMKQDGRTTITRSKGPLTTETETIPVVMTTMPVAFTLTKGEDVLLSERQYDGKAVWRVNERGSGYPNNRYRRFEAAIGQAVKKLLKDITPRTVTRKVRVDYSDKKQEPILNAARNGQVKEAAVQLEDYVERHPNSASAVYNLAVLTDAMGQYERALEYYNGALSLGGKSYYTEAKTACMSRLNKKKEMMEEDEQPFSRASERQSPEQTHTRTSEEQGTQQPEERPGDGGQDVAWVQKTLNEIGYDCGVEDGLMGPSTRSCIRAFQHANSLQVTGSVNEATYEKILELR